MDHALQLNMQHCPITTSLCLFLTLQASAGPDEVGKVSDIRGIVTGWDCGSHLPHSSTSCGTFLLKEEVQGPR